MSCFCDTKELKNTALKYLNAISIFSRVHTFLKKFCVWPPSTLHAVAQHLKALAADMPLAQLCR
jgi:hypothetical protein